MEDLNSVSAKSNEPCPSCNTSVTDTEVFCTNCGYPLKGTDFEQRSFIADKEVLNIDLDSFGAELRKARNTLYYLAGLFVVIGLVNFFIKKDDPEVLAYVIPYIVLAILFFALGGYSMKKPLACLVSGLCLYVIVQVLNVIDNPVNLARGIIIKIAIIAYLIKGIKSAIEIERIKKENNIA